MANPEHLKILGRGVDAWNRWRKQNPFIVPELSKAVLSSCKLSGANFGTADLWGASLDKADLNGGDFDSANLFQASLKEANLAAANFQEANLERADLSGAFLYKAIFWNATLRHACLVRADLTAADLGGANLAGAQLEFANLDRAGLTNSILADNDLSVTSGLDEVEHGGPVTIGIDTLFRSQGKIPEVFLRGCGVPEILIQHLPSLIGLPIQFYSSFISYSHEDKAFARLLHDRLQGRGIRCWLDEHQLLPGDDLHEGIDRGIRLWDKVLLCASKTSLTSWWVDGEISRAFQKEAQIMKERSKKVLALIPLNLDGFLFSADYQSGKKAEITSRVAANFVGWEKDHALFDRELEKVIRALRTDDTGREKPPSPRL